MLVRIQLGPPVTIRDLQNMRKFQINSRIREIARGLFESTGVCSKCGYSKHTELHHIKPINSFPPSTLVSVVNNPNNLQELCPNCHWEANQKGEFI